MYNAILNNKLCYNIISHNIIYITTWQRSPALPLGGL